MPDAPADMPIKQDQRGVHLSRLKSLIRSLELAGVEIQDTPDHLLIGCFIFFCHFFEKFNTGFAQRDRHLNVFFFCFLFLTYNYPN
jgi:hypothetical protein